MTEKYKKYSTLMRKIFRSIFFSYTAIAGFIGTAVICYVSLAAYAYLTASARLPNGYALVPTMFNRENIRLTDTEGNPVVAPTVGGVMWCGNIIYGYRWETIDTHPKIDKALEEVEDMRIVYNFMYDGDTKELSQYEYSLNYTLSGKHQNIDLRDGSNDTFREIIRARKLPELSPLHSVGYLDAIKDSYGKMEKYEDCIKSNTK